MQGMLTTTCLPDLLRRIYTERRGGELILTQGTVKKQIYFELGQIVFAASNRKEDRIGEALVRHGKLTREQLDQFLGTLGRGRHLGKALVERGVISDRELITYVTFQLIDIIYSLFTWTIGSYELAEGEQNRAPEELKLKFSTATIILEGVRRIEDFDIIRRGLGDLNRLITPSASPLLRLQSIALKPIERQVLDLVTQPMDILRVLINNHEAPQKTLQALYGLLSVGLLQQVASAELSATTGKFVIPEAVQKQAETAPPVEYAARATAPLRLEDAALINELTTMKERIASKDPRAILGLSAQANGGDIRDAYYRLATKFHPDKFIQSNRQVREDVDFIFNSITDSYNRLRSGITAANLRPAIPPVNITNAPTTTGAMPSVNSAPAIEPNIPASTPRLAPPPPGYTAPQNPPLSRSQMPTKPLTPPPAMPAASTSLSSSSPGISLDNINRGVNRAVSDGSSYSGFEMHKRPARGNPASNKVDIEAALNDLIDYLDDRKAPLFVADSLSSLLRTKAPIHVEQTRVVEAVVSWARQKASWSGKPIHEMFISVLSSIKHAEQARVIQDFDPNVFYASFIRELVSYCPPGEADDFLAKVGSI